RIVPLAQAGPGKLGFLADRGYLKHLDGSVAEAVLVSADLSSSVRDRVPNLLVTEQPRVALAQLLERLHPSPPARPGIHASAVLGRGVRLGKDVCIAAYAVLEEDVEVGDRVRIGAHVSVGRGSRIADDSELYPQVVLYPGTRLGQRVVLHAGTVVGSDGFGYVGPPGAPPEGPSGGRLPHRRRCRNGRPLLHRPGVHRGHRDRRRHQDRQPGACGSQRDRGRTLPSHCPSGDLRIHDPRKGRGDGGPVRCDRASRDRRRGAGRCTDRCPPRRTCRDERGRLPRTSARRILEVDGGDAPAARVEGPGEATGRPAGRAGEQPGNRSPGACDFMTRARQRTIGRKVSLDGIGIHLGEPASVSFHPAKADSGVLFRRVDLPGKPRDSRDSRPCGGNRAGHQHRSRAGPDPHRRTSHGRAGRERDHQCAGGSVRT
ncbi:UDP-3-O-acylglucosamine N-acyltransferase, partial [Geodia barretti]